MTDQSAVLEIQGVSISFSRYKDETKGFDRTNLSVLQDMHLTVHEGEMVAVVGSSGSGKSLLAHAILGILPYNAILEGTMRYRGEPLTPARQKALRGSEIVLVPQSVSYLDPLQKVAGQIQGGRKGPEAAGKAADLLSRFGLEQRVGGLYPFQLSGGMARRVLIATALMGRPGLVIADEPTPGLHASVAARVMGHFREMADEGAGVLVITHDLELALMAADRIVVFYGGTALEEALARDFEAESTLRHPYTKALWRAMPQNGFQATAGGQPFGEAVIQGCLYGPRCPIRTQACEGHVPYRPLSAGHVRCIHSGPGGEST